MRRRESEAWLDLMPPIAALNAEAHRSRHLDRQDLATKKEERASVPARRVVAREAFARMHAMIEAGGEV